MPKHNTIRILPDGSGRFAQSLKLNSYGNQYLVRFNPNNIGFYTFDVEKETVEEAFERLKSHLIKYRQRKIKKMEGELKELLNMEYEPTDGIH